MGDPTVRSCRAIAFQIWAIGGKDSRPGSYVALSGHVRPWRAPGPPLAGLPKGLKSFPAGRLRVRKPVCGVDFRFFAFAQNDSNYNALALSVRGLPYNPFVVSLSNHKRPALPQAQGERGNIHQSKVVELPGRVVKLACHSCESSPPRRTGTTKRDAGRLQPSI